jgi:hypothetical protein
MRRAWGWAVVWASSAASTASAQTPLELDTVLVGTFAHGLDIAPEEAEAFRQGFLRALGDDHILIDMETVPGFRDVPPSLYLQACPPGRLPGCLAVVAQRVEVDWAVSVEVTRDPDDGGLVGEAVYVRVADGELHHQLPVDFREEPARAYAAMADALDLVVAETFRPLDISRLQAADLDAAARARQAALARSEVDDEALRALEQSEGELVRGEIRADVARVTSFQIRQLASREGDPPWKRLHLTAYQYRRQKNTRIPMRDFQRRAAGRQAQLLVGTGVGGGVGPYGQAWEGWYLLDRADLSVVDRATSLETVRSDADAVWTVEVGAGVLPWLSVHLDGGTRASNWTQRLQRVVEGDAFTLEPTIGQVLGTWHLGGHVELAPLPTFPARPTLGLGAVAWWGTRPEKILTAEPPKGLSNLDAVRQVLLRLSPGFEVDVGRHLALWGRADVEVPVAGVTVQRDAQPTGPLGEVFPEPGATGDGVGIAGRAGITAKIPLRRR